MGKRKMAIDTPIGIATGTPNALWDVYTGKIAELEKRNAALEVDLSQTKRGDLPSFVDKLTQVWLETGSKQERPREPIYLEDPVYGQLELDRRLSPVFFHPLLQRLNYVRQLSFAYLIFPSASHTRLSHILGAVRNAKTAMRTMFDKGVVYSPDGPHRIELTMAERDRCCLKAQLCALLHDIGHGPFGHALDKLIPYIGSAVQTEVPDKEFSIAYIQWYLKEPIKQAGFDIDEILPILDKEQQAELTSYDILIADIIDSPLDVDRMDYLARDGHMTGLGMGYSNIEALIEHMRPFRDPRGNINLTYEESALPHLQHFLYARDIMYINCYENKRKVCAERLLVRLAEYLLEKGVKREALMLLTDDQLLTTLSWFLPTGSPERDCLTSLQRNSYFYAAAEYYLSKWDSTQNKTVFNSELSSACKAWMDSRVKPGGAKLRYTFIDEPEAWEKKICASAGIQEADAWKVVVTVPAYDAAQQRESGAQVLRKHQGRYETAELFDSSLVMKAVITNLRPSREVIRILVHESLPEQEAERVRTAADETFKA